MRKLKLELTDLEVTSFAVAGETGDAGTVAGQGNIPVETGAPTCNGDYTCVSCADTCQGTCAGGVCGSWPMTYCPQCYYA
ncbi:MAG TPA: hypothetical protein VEX86_00495 [Longimicrobium sp.]|nr:hypothetical protein [Longimicrobium sp.]